jgi:hypothetical protein
MNVINKQLADAIKLENTKFETEIKFPENKITRLEVIEANNGRAYVNMNATNIEFSLQDDGRTLKIFVK